jgi:hypothetical protein
LYFIKKSILIKKYLGKDFTIENIMEKFAECKNVFLKLDIEGFEYDLLESILKCKELFTGICIEFHNLDLTENCLKLDSFINKLDFDILNVSVNEVCLIDNKFPSVLEISFLPKYPSYWPIGFSDNFYLQNSNALNSDNIVLEFL